jgi:hypothetical protein
MTEKEKLKLEQHLIEYVQVLELVLPVVESAYLDDVDLYGETGKTTKTTFEVLQKVKRNTTCFLSQLDTLHLG